MIEDEILFDNPHPLLRCVAYCRSCCRCVTAVPPPTPFSTPGAASVSTVVNHSYTHLSHLVGLLFLSSICMEPYCWGISCVNETMNLRSKCNLIIFMLFNYFMKFKYEDILEFKYIYLQNGLNTVFAKSLNETYCLNMCEDNL